jgi:hypothetical protein
MVLQMVVVVVLVQMVDILLDMHFFDYFYMLLQHL